MVCPNTKSHLSQREISGTKLNYFYKDIYYLPSMNLITKNLVPEFSPNVMS